MYPILLLAPIVAGELLIVHQDVVFEPPEHRFVDFHFYKERVAIAFKALFELFDDVHVRVVIRFVRGGFWIFALLMKRLFVVKVDAHVFLKELKHFVRSLFIFLVSQQVDAAEQLLVLRVNALDAGFQCFIP
jgi:hypothetical protein